MRPGRAWAAGVAVAFLCALLIPPAALAHARLERAEPAAGAQLTAAPPLVRLTLSEAVSPQFSTIQVLDRSRRDWAIPPLLVSAADKATVQIPLQPDLPSGVYTVVWRAISAVDGHVTLGSYAFSLQGPGAPAAGEPLPTDAPPLAGGESDGAAGTSPAPSPFRWAWRALALLSGAALLGGPLFSSLVLAGAPVPEVQPLARPLGQRLAVLMTVSAAILLWALAADMIYQVAAVTGTGLGGAFAQPGIAGQIVTTTGYGAYWAVRVVAALALLGYGAWRSRVPGRLDWSAGVLNGGIVLAGEALGSHEAAARPIAGLPLGMIGDLVHLLAAAAWVGGLLYLALVLLPVLRRADPGAAERLLGSVVPRFSRLAMLSVGGLVVTGLANLALHTLQPAAIVDSDYGRLLILKHLLFLPLLALGAVNNQILSPRFVALLLPDGPMVAGNLLRRFGRTVAAEAVLGTAVILCAAGLTLLPPPTPVTAGPALPAGSAPPPLPGGPTPATASTPVVARAEQTVSGVRFGLVVAPDPTGDHFTLDLRRTDPATVPLTDVLKLQVRTVPQEVDAGSTSLALNRVGPLDPDHQVYTATAQILTLSGAYQLNAELFRRQSDDLRTGFRLVLAGDGGLAIAQSDVLQAILTTRPSPPISGTATIDIHVLDGRQQPVTGAALKLTPLMPAHGHVEPTSAPAEVAGQPGVYRTEAHLPMGGAWLVIVEVDRAGRPPVKIDGSFNVIDPNATPAPVK